MESDVDNQKTERLRVALISDIHNEYLRRSNNLPDLHIGDQKIDVIVLAGDIDTQGFGAHWAVRQSELFNVPVIYVLGNHEFYDASEEVSALEQIREITHSTNVHVLDCESVVIKGCRFIGATMWTDFNLLGAHKKARVLQQVLWNMNDFEQIALYAHDNRKVTPNDMMQWFKHSISYIKTELEQPFDGKTIVVTHHAPSALCMPAGYEYDLLSAAYANNLDELIEQLGPNAWFYGHIHHAKSQRIGRTLVMNHPAGYPGNQYGVVSYKGLKPMIVVL
ncbi:hypothetical protein LCGC14_0997380 [marine sediment metagenome]|uniref:Calcineurin-like phosphoesterase domain-containing protein n=1 Tax=marine sediment metagenome TaxID=412755 RepID=A0A0F9QMK4_9ZZZZ|nr:metallo-dependent phosphatase [Methylophaga sp.]HEC58922.1 metallo-dependent phosphatase [Methylophaga sp.]